MLVKEVFGIDKPIIGMCHLQPLPGDPFYDHQKGLKSIIESTRNDLRSLINGGVDAVMFSNEFSLPYLTEVEVITVATMARIIGELMEDITIPFGVDVLWDPIKTFDLAKAVGAAFVREVFTGVYASDYGLWNTNYGQTARHRHQVSADLVFTLFNIFPESAVYLSNRNIADIAKSTVFNNKPDAICVSGLTAGVPTDNQTLQIVKKAVKDTPVFINTGVNPSNVEELLKIADGCVVGTYFKKDGKFENAVDYDRVRYFMNIANKLR